MNNKSHFYFKLSNRKKKPYENVLKDADRVHVCFSKLLNNRWVIYYEKTYLTEKEGFFWNVHYLLIVRSIGIRSLALGGERTYNYYCFYLLWNILWVILSSLMIWGSISHLTMCHTNDVVTYETQRRPASSLMSVVHKISGFVEKIHPSKGSEKHEPIWQGMCPRDASELCDQPWRLKIKGKLSPWHAHDEDLQNKAGYFLQAPHKSMLSPDHIPPLHRTRWQRPSSWLLVPTHLLPLVKDRQGSSGCWSSSSLSILHPFFRG